MVRYWKEQDETIGQRKRSKRSIREIHDNNWFPRSCCQAQASSDSSALESLPRKHIEHQLDPSNQAQQEETQHDEDELHRAHYADQEEQAKANLALAICAGTRYVQRQASRQKQ
jgi:hypothetical protein